MGACATKPKVLGDKARRRFRRPRPSSNSFNANDSSSSISFAHYKDQDTVNNRKDFEDKLPSYDDDLDIHDPSIKDEAEQIRSAITKAIEQSKNDVVEEADVKEEEKELSNPTPTIPAGENDVLDPEIPVGEDDVVGTETPARVHEVDSSSTKNDAVVVEAVSPSKDNVAVESAMETDGMITSSLPHHASKDPKGMHDAQDHQVIKEEDNVITTNMPSTFAF